MVYDLYYDGLRWQVDLDGVLVAVYNTGNRREIYIPSVICSGDNCMQIKAIGSCCFKGLFSKITISNTIERVYENAFKKADVHTVVWSAGCKCIPRNCFENSAIEKILNIEGVTEICSYAFYMSNIQKMAWPAACDFIPYLCFGNSCLESISNIGAVTSVGIGAFSGCNINKIKWPSGCGEVPMNCFRRSELKEITNIDNINEISICAFASSRLKHLDLSNTCIIDIKQGAFEGIDPDKITFPYYFAEDVIESAFCEY